MDAKMAFGSVALMVASKVEYRVATLVVTMGATMASYLVATTVLQ